ncbi:MAG: PAS domain S-box protein [Rhizobiaceae bacterium]|nr:PAS domain S-box protein [Rhizobiaceae bacterium]
MLSAAFAEAVGPAAADVIGRSFRDVAQVFGFDAGGEIARLLDRRDTWSGRSILWPVENSDRKVPVDLAALPVYARDRSFDGFRGFGIVKMNEPVEDEEGIGRLLSAAPAQGEGLNRPEDMAEGATPSGAETSAPPNSSRPLLRTFPGEAPAAVFGRRAEPPVSQPSSVEEEPSAIGDDPDYASGDANDRNGDDPAPRIIRLDDRRRPKDGVLSDAEEAAFRAIGMKLGSPAAPDRPAARIATDGALPKTPPFVDGRVPVATETPDVVQADGARPSASPIDEGGGDDQDHTEAGLVSVDTFQAMVGGLPIPLLLASQGDVVFANREFAELTGYEDILTLSDRGGIGALFAERTGEPGDGDVSILRFDGRPVDVRVHLQRVALAGRSHLLMSFLPPLSSPLSLVPRDGAATFPANAAEEDATAPDIGVPTPASEPSENTEAVAIEDLRKQVEELQAVLDTATDGIVLLDPAGTIRAMNGSAHALFGIAQDDHQGRHLSSLFAHESQKATHDYLEMLRDDGLAGILNDGREVIGRVAQGGFIPLFITIGRLSGERGWCVVIRDIAHWKRIEEDLVNARRQAEAASLHKSRFLANISHELRTPLNAIIGFADVMASECFGPIGNERYLEYLGDIKRSGHHVLDLVNDLLDISKIESGKLDLDFEAVSLNEVVQEVVSLMQPQANRERVIVRSNLPATVPPVVADRRTMRQIALNLIANAIRFTPAGGQIIASTTYTAEGDVLLRFRDSGIGMTEREIEIALTPFQQVHAPSVTRGEGTGLGLPLTKAMVEANRAAFAIQSTPGEGTLVEIAFPPQRVLAD